jgi:hypothetical protein
MMVVGAWLVGGKEGISASLTARSRQDVMNAQRPSDRDFLECASASSASKIASDWR